MDDSPLFSPSYAKLQEDMLKAEVKLVTNRATFWGVVAVAAACALLVGAAVALPLIVHAWTAWL